MGAWMLYASGVGGVLAVAGMLAERGLRHLGLPVRWVWVAAMAGTITVMTGLTGTTVLTVAAGAVMGLGTLSDRLLLLGWAVGALVLTANLRLSAWTLRRNQRSWGTRRLEGGTVLVSADFGPGVVGASRPRIVVPGWVLGSGSSLERLIMTHEREHVRAGDARLLLLGNILPALIPWCLPLWWQRYRLRSAVETDCDARVLRATGRPREYARALVDVAGRTGRGFAPVPALAPARAELERRIRLITASAADRSRSAALLSLTAAAALVFSLVAVPRPAPDVRSPDGRYGSPGHSAATAPVDAEAPSAVVLFSVPGNSNAPNRLH